jgi:hypothetical protein
MSTDEFAPLAGTIPAVSTARFVVVRVGTKFEMFKPVEVELEEL